MSTTRFAPWVVLACIGTLAACTSTEDGPTGNTELNILIPNGNQNNTSSVPPGVTPIDVKSVEYTIVCTGGEQPAGGFLEPGDGFADAVTLNGNVEVNDNLTPPVAQAIMDIPPGDCLLQLRARDNDGEVICTGDNVLDPPADQNVDANEIQVITVILDCYNISYQAPVGQIDFRGTFIYSVGNFCPDLFVLNCVDTNLFAVPGTGNGGGLPCTSPLDCLSGSCNDNATPGDPTDDFCDGGDFGPDVEGQTTCETRFRDNDNGCGEGCDPQDCSVDTTTGLLDCGPDPTPQDQDGILMGTAIARTTVECRSPGGVLAPMDCDNNGTFESNGSCVYNSTSQNDSTGSLFQPPPNTQTNPNPPDFGVNCDNAGTGETITCEAYTTDGDRDCDKIKTVDVNCAGLTQCEVFGGDAACQAAAGTVCIVSTCDNTTCDGANAAVCCDDVNAADGTDCSAEDPPLAECLGGACVGQACLGNADCEDFNDCTQPQTCNTGTGTCEPDPAINVADGTTCDVINGSNAADGVCDTGVCELFACAADGDCDDTNPCTDNTCNTATPAGVCVFTNNDANSCTTCPGVGGASCECSAGSCVDGGIPLVCVQYSPVGVPTGQTCDGSPGQECICEKPEFIAVDCELLGNSAALPLAASVQQLGVAFVGDPLPTIVQDAVILPAALICGFGDAGFFSSEVNNSIINAGVAGDGLASTVLLSSYLDDGTTPAGCTQGVNCALVSPHNAVFFDFEVACGRFVGACGAGGAGLCPDGTACTDDAECEEHGSGIIAPFLANAPGAVPIDRPSPTVFVPNGASVDVSLPYSGLALALQNLEGPVSIPSACIGGSCPADTCSPIVRGAVASPRVMYDSNCDKPAFGAGDCTPFLQFPDAAGVCAGRGISALPAPDCCDNSSDLFCSSAANITACCNSIGTDFPTATTAQFPQVWVN